MNVCIVASGDFFSDYGGGQVYVRNIVDELARHSELSLTVISFNANLQPSIKDYNGILVQVVNNETSLLDAFKTIQPDIVHANGEKLISSRLCKRLNIPCIVTAHHGGLVCPAGTLLNTNDEICNVPADYSYCLKCYLRTIPTGLFWYPLLKNCSQKHYCRIGELLEKLPSVPFLTPIGRTGQIVTTKLKDWKELAYNATHFIAPSNAIAEALKRNGCPTDKITIIPHGIPQSQNIYHQTSNIKHINFYYVGRINYNKGIHILLKAFTSINNPSIELHLIGGAANKTEEHYEKKLKKTYRNDTRVFWHGKVPHEQLEKMTTDFHCLIHPAIYLEVFGLNISEALAKHKYVISTLCGGAEMQIHNKNEGTLVEANDDVALKNAIEQYINHPRQTFAKVYSIDEHINQLMQVYAKQLQTNKKQ